jgi:hypothetical protein
MIAGFLQSRTVNSEHTKSSIYFLLSTRPVACLPPQVPLLSELLLLLMNAHLVDRTRHHPMSQVVAVQRTLFVSRAIRHVCCSATLEFTT